MDEKIQITLAIHIKKLGISQKDFATLSGLREATVSQLVNNKYDRIQLSHLLTVMNTLKINDFNEILVIEKEEQYIDEKNHQS